MLLPSSKFKCKYTGPGEHSILHVVQCRKGKKGIRWQRQPSDGGMRGNPIGEKGAETGGTGPSMSVGGAVAQ